MDLKMSSSRSRTNTTTSDKLGANKSATTPITSLLVSTNNYLEREQKYLRENAEIEKKSSELFERIEKFEGRKSKFNNRMMSGGGDGSDYFCDENNESSECESNFSHYTTSTNFDMASSEKLSEKLNVLAENKSGRSMDRSRLQRATESVIRSLQSKLVNHEERLAEIHLQYRQKIQENTMLESKVRLLEDEREKLFKTVTTLQQTVEKHARASTELKSALGVKEQNLVSLRKELDESRREHRLSSGNAQSFQTRLHRANEENEKLKSTTRSLSQQMRENSTGQRQKLDEAANRISELEKQKALLQSTISKQAQLIEKFKRGSARSLNYRDEEFLSS